MNTIQLNNEVGTTIYTDTDLSTLTAILNEARAILIIDEKVAQILQPQLPPMLTYKVASGEHSKSLREAAEIYRWLQNNGVDRETAIVGMGGGVVTDLAGFVAATYMRGVPLLLVPTTLLAQVDASIGGKNAVNLHGFKNIIGTFYQPQYILCDYHLLHSLPQIEVQGGVAEMIKHCMIADPEMFDYFGAHADAILSLDMAELQKIIPWSINIKKHFIEADIRDHNLRRTLNFGHTWGHALEAVKGIHHGLAVGIGMCFATRLAVQKGLCSPTVLDALEQLLTRFGLPTQSDVVPWVVFDAMKRDKKRSASNLNFILPRAIGETEIVEISFDELHNFISSL